MSEQPAGGQWQPMPGTEDCIAVRGEPGPGKEIRNLQGMCDLANSLERQLAEQAKAFLAMQETTDRVHREELQAAERRAEQAEEERDDIRGSADAEAHLADERGRKLTAAKRALREIAKEAEVRKHSPHMNDEPLHTVISQKARAALSKMEAEQ